MIRDSDNQSRDSICFLRGSSVSSHISKLTLLSGGERKCWTLWVKGEKGGVGGVEMAAKRRGLMDDPLGLAWSSHE